MKLLSINMGVSQEQQSSMVSAEAPALTSLLSWSWSWCLAQQEKETRTVGEQ